MNKGEFISEVAAKTGQPKKLVSDIVDAAMDVTLDAMRKGEGRLHRRLWQPDCEAVC